MDQELRAFLTERFDAIDRRFAVVDQRFDTIDRRFAVVDQRFDAIDRRFEGADRRLDEMRAEFGERLDAAHTYFTGLFEQNKRDFGVLVEGLRVEVQVVAEGHGVLARRIEELHEEHLREHRETRALLTSSHAGLDRRVTRLEAVTADHETRLRGPERDA